jgi:murein DD-endopeptidase MepM/ murein hydrolase activator NlpD
MARRSKKRIPLIILVLVAVVLGCWGIWGAFRVGPEVEVMLETDRTAIGPGTTVEAHFAEPEIGFGDARLELEQGDCRVELASLEVGTRSPFRPFGSVGPHRGVLRAEVGKGNPECLEEGEATLRAVVERIRGPLRVERASTAEATLPVRFRAPRVQLLSGQHYVRQGGSGAVAFHVDEAAVRSGVRAGKAEFTSYPMTGGESGDRFTLFGVPWDHATGDDVRVFAEDAAGNRAEIPFLTGFKAAPPKTDVIRLPDSFLRRVVPAIASQTPEFEAEGELVDQYVWINSVLREKNRELIAELSERSVEEKLWVDEFLQLPNSQRMAGFAETRRYLYEGRQVDQQTHLGLDFASVARDEVPAPNAGRVLSTGYYGIYGNAVVLDHGYGLVSVCAHLSRIDVEEGQFVDKGQPIGRTGRTGLAGGDHLHLGMFIQGVAVDPIEWLDGRWIRHRILPRIRVPAAE